MKRTIVAVLLLIVATSAFEAYCRAQTTDSEMNAAIESVRADMRADKVAIVTQVMKLAPAEADKFWPVYREYEAEVAKLNDHRIAILKDYVAKYTTMTDAEAKGTADKFFEWETSRTELRKRYFNKFAKATSAITATKFFQVEHRLDLLIDLELASEIPGLFVKSAGVRSEQ